MWAFGRIGLVVSLFTLGSAAPALASPGWVTPAADVSSSPTGSSNQALIASDAKGDTAIVWQVGGSGPFYESERPAGGTFTIASQIVLMSGGSDLNQSAPEDPSLFIDNAGTIYFFFLSGSGSGSTTQSNVATKPIGGSTWSITVLQSKGNVGGFIPNPPVAGAAAPNGAAVATWVHENTGNFLGSSMQYSVKAAGSSSWSTPVQIPNDTTPFQCGLANSHVATDSNGDAALVFQCVGASDTWYGTTSAAGASSWTTPNVINTSPGGSSTAAFGGLAMSSTGEATAVWVQTDNTGANPIVQFSSKTLSATSWPQAAGRGGANDLSTAGAGTPSLAIAPDGTTTVAFANGSNVIVATRPASGGSFTSAMLPNSLTSPFGADVVVGGDGSTTVLWSGTSGSTPAVAGAYRPPGGSFGSTPNAPGVSDSGVSAVADGVGDVAATWNDQASAGNYQFDASGLVTAPPTITNVIFPSAATVGTPFTYTATITPDQWTTAVGTWSFGDGTTGPVSGMKTYAGAGAFSAVLTATDPFGNMTTKSVSIIASNGGGGGPGTTAHPPGSPKLHSTILKKTRTARFTWTDSGATGFVCALVKIRHGHRKPKPHYAACGSPKLYKHLKRGRYEFFVRGKNAKGLSNPATKKFTI